MKVAYRFPKKTIRDIDLNSKRVLLRADFNVPIKDGQIESDYRIVRTIPTIKHLTSQGCSVIIIAHLGRPDGQPDPTYSLAPVAKRLQQLLDQPIQFVSDCISDGAYQTLKNLDAGSVTLLENLRFHPGEKAGQAEFAAALKRVSQADYFVQDAFGNAHRTDASMVAVTQLLPSVAGLLLENEVSTLESATLQPHKPLVAVLGGAKISDKIGLLERFVELADTILVGGAMANTFFEYLKLPIGKSIWEDGQQAEIERIIAAIAARQQRRVDLKQDPFCVLPSDVAIGHGLEADTKRYELRREQVQADQYILDIGTHSMTQMQQVLQSAGTVIWNGTMGYAELPQFALGSAAIAEVMADLQNEATTIVGGGDTADFVLDWDKQLHGGSFSHVSTGGGASLTLLSGQALPAVEALLPR